MSPLSFWHGQRFYQVALAPNGDGYIGYCNGRVVAKAPDAPTVVRALVLTSRWRP